MTMSFTRGKLPASQQFVDDTVIVLQTFRRLLREDFLSASNLMATTLFCNGFVGWITSSVKTWSGIYLP